MPSYNIVRIDTPGVIPKNGVHIYIHSSIVFESLNLPLTNLVGIHFPYRNFYILIVYHLPSSLLVDDAILLSFLENFIPEKELILKGDFNLPSIG